MTHLITTIKFLLQGLLTPIPVYFGGQRILRRNNALGNHLSELSVFLLFLSTVFCMSIVLMTIGESICTKKNTKSFHSQSQRGGGFQPEKNKYRSIFLMAGWKQPSICNYWLRCSTEDRCRFSALSMIIIQCIQSARQGSMIMYTLMFCHGPKISVPLCSWKVETMVRYFVEIERDILFFYRRAVGCSESQFSSIVFWCWIFELTKEYHQQALIREGF